MSLFRKKSLTTLLAQAADSEKGLKRTLGAGALVALGIGAIIGAGLFVRTAAAAGGHAGSAVTISFIIAAIGCAFAGLCYAEFASMIPIAGSAYTYAYATLGKLFAWIIGWDLILEYLFGASSVAVGWSGYVCSFLKDFGIIIPASFSSAPFGYDVHTGWYLTGAIVNVPAILVIVVMTNGFVLQIYKNRANIFSAKNHTINELNFYL